jgi:hypothetical protein
MATQSSNLIRFQPRVASKASGTPLRRYQNQLKHAATIITHRRLPLTEVKAQVLRKQKK